MVFFYKNDLVIFSLIICPVIYLFQHRLMDIHFVLWVINNSNSFCWSNCSSFWYWEVLHSCVPLTHHPCNLTYFLCFFLPFPLSFEDLISDTTRCSILILYIYCPNIGISHLLRRPGCFLLDNDIRNQDLDAMNAPW